MPHLLELADFLTSVRLAEIEPIAFWSCDVHQMAQKVFSYLTSLLGHCSGSLSRYGCPPYSYSGILKGDITSLQRMKKDLKLLIALELSGVPHSDNLLADAKLLANDCVRLCMLGFEASGWNPNHRPSTEILISLVRTLPDSKLIEDTHGRIRMRQKSQSNEKLTRPAVQLIVNDSGTLEEREIRHGPAVTQDAFLQLWRETKDTYKANARCNPKTHKLPKFFGKIMKRERSWAAITEPNLRCSAAAWEWLRYYSSEDLSQSLVQIQAIFWGRGNVELEIQKKHSKYSSTASGVLCV